LIKSAKYIGDNPHRKHCKFTHLLSRLNRKYGVMDKRQKGRKEGRKEKGQELETNTESILYSVYTTLNRKDR